MTGYGRGGFECVNLEGVRMPDGSVGESSQKVVKIAKCDHAIYKPGYYIQGSYLSYTVAFV